MPTPAAFFKFRAVRRALFLAEILLYSISANPYAQGQSVDEIEAHCGKACTLAVHLENVIPGTSIYGFPLENAGDFDRVRNFLSRKIARQAAVDVTVVTPGQEKSTSIAPINRPATALYSDFVQDSNGVEMAASLGLRQASQEELESPLNILAAGLQLGFSSESMTQLVVVGTDAALPLENMDNEATSPLGAGASLKLAGDGSEASDPRQESFWQVLRTKIAGNGGLLTASVIIGTSVTAINTTTIILSSGVSLPQALVVGGLMGSVSGTMNFWTAKMGQWYGSGRWSFRGETPGAEETGKFGRFVRMNSKRAFVGWTLGMLFRITFRATGIMPGGVQLLDSVEMANNTMYGVATGYPWSKVTTNLARKEGYALPGYLKRLSNPATLSFILALAYQAGSVLYHVPGYESTGRIVVGAISLAGVPIWIYQSINLKEMGLALALKAKSLGKAVWCSVLKGSYAFHGPN